MFWIKALVVSIMALVQPLAEGSRQDPDTFGLDVPVSGSDLASGLAAARAGNVSGAQSIAAGLNDPIDRLIVRWASIDVSGAGVGLTELEASETDLAGWPRADARRDALERALAGSGASASRIIELLGRDPLRTPEGAMVLAEAYRASGRTAEAQTLIRDWWRGRSFDLGPQQQMLDRFGSWLTTEDHDARLDLLLYGPQGPATQAMLALASPRAQQLASARMAIRGGDMAAFVPAGGETEPGIAVERARRYRLDGTESLGFSLLSRFPAAPASTDGQNLLWTERRNYFLDALELREWRAAYDAMAGHGFPGGERRVDAEFFAGWVALTKLSDPTTAERHFEALRQMSTTPITQGRALYWLGRAAEARGDIATADARFREGARHIGAFYGQLAAERAGLNTLTLPAEPQPTAADRQRFEAYPLTRAIRRLAQAGETSLVRVFVMHMDDSLEIPTDYALLVDLAREYGMQDLSMHVARTAAQRGVLMPDRAYPFRTPPSVPLAPDPAFVLAITRQESAFDPRARSSADARGMMQLLPSTARNVARQMGVEYSEAMLFDPDYNMQLGSYHLGDLLASNGGSYLLTTVAYNAGPLRAEQWVPRCGDPRGARVDPIDFIECAPFTETRNYMMRVMENMQVYRAKLNGGQAEITLTRELARGG